MSSIRVAAHVHSEWSYDGSWSLDRIAKVFSRRGYRVALITEHDRGFNEARRLQLVTACRMASSPEILLVPGLEYSDPSNTIHLLVWGEVPFVGCNAEPEQVLAAAQESGGITVFAHPSRKAAWKRFKLDWAEQLFGIEFWNRKTDGWAPSGEARALLKATRAIPFAGLDFHDARQFFPLAMILEIDGPINEASVLGALRARRCKAEAWGVDAAAFESGLHVSVLHRAESLRRMAARSYRRLSGWLSPMSKTPRTSRAGSDSSTAS